MRLGKQQSLVDGNSKCPLAPILLNLIRIHTQLGSKPSKISTYLNDLHIPLPSIIPTYALLYYELHDFQSNGLLSPQFPFSFSLVRVLTRSASSAEVHFVFS